MKKRTAIRRRAFEPSFAARRCKIFALFLAIAACAFTPGFSASLNGTSNSVHLQQTSVANPSQLVFSLVPAQAKLHYTLNATAHDVHGDFDVKRGVIGIEPATGQASGEIVVDATSGRSGSKGRDSKMHKDVLESAKYPEINFRPDRIEGFTMGAAAIHASVHGVFSLHGADHEITIPVDATLSANSWTATAKFSVPYVQWGLRDPSNFLLHVGESVEIELTVSGTIQPAAAARKS